eukprot:GHVU01225552.1.p1 GENE.GHVU01225552.1~~GHVU01225552.1.p1  ORF type:complete len:291 (+),score=27.55 GHVU01225552.1:506-1378(+)
MVTLVPTRLDSSSDLVKGLQRVLVHAQLVAAQDRHAENREFRLQQRVQQAEADRAIGQELMEKALEELRELQKRTKESRPDPVAMDENRKSLRDLVESAIITRTAEALRRRATERLLIGVAASEQVHRSTALRNAETCHCYATSQAALAAGTTLPGTTSNLKLVTTVERVLQSMSVRQPVDLDSYSIEEYDFRDKEDRTLVGKAIADGKDNTATYQILVNSLCLDPRQTAEARIKDNCPFLLDNKSAQPATLDTAVIVSTPSVAREVVITDNDDADTETTPSSSGSGTLN